MAYDLNLANRVREYLANLSQYTIEEKEMFKGLAFLVNEKMCISISGENLMCRYNPALQEEVAEKAGYQTLVMRGKEMNGFCYVTPDGLQKQTDFNFWMNLCLEFNHLAKSSKKKK